MSDFNIIAKIIIEAGSVDGDRFGTMKNNIVAALEALDILRKSANTRVSKIELDLKAAQVSLSASEAACAGLKKGLSELTSGWGHNHAGTYSGAANECPRCYADRLLTLSSNPGAGILKEVEELRAWNQNQARSIQVLGTALATRQPELARLRSEVEGLEKALEGILSNVSLDWYVQQFGKDETPTGVSSGIVAKIHNHDTLNRVRMAFQRAREALAAVKKGRGE